MKLYVNRKIVKGPWGGGNKWVEAFVKGLQDSLVQSVDPYTSPDVIVVAGLDNDGASITAEQAVMFKLMYSPKTKIVLRVNENDARKGTTGVDDAWLKVSEHVTGTVFVSHWLQDYFLNKGWKCNNNTVIHNGVDGDVFNEQPKLENGKVNIVAHHWSNHPMKGFDFYEKIDEFVKKNKGFEFTYIGRDRRTFKNTNLVHPLSGKKLGEELGKHDVYVSASRFDPGPNHILESISCGLPTYVHVDGGGCVEFAGNDHVFSDWKQLEKLLKTKKFVKNEFKPQSWKTCIDEYSTFINGL